MRISSAAIGPLLLLAGCGPQRTDQNVLAEVEANQGAAASEAGRIMCAHGQAVMTRDCTVERTQDARGLILTLHHPDGAFRRLLVTKDGRGVAAADGAQKAAVTIVGPASIAVAIGGDRYELPATISGTKRTTQ
ncbi:MAG: hypothetical protein M3R41_07710 [Pseudomonadota bacterium]|nr:hypothetical protein [Pseudomonadota bacterium]